MTEACGDNDEDERETGVEVTDGEHIVAADDLEDAGREFGEERGTQFYGATPEPFESVAWFYCVQGPDQGRLCRFAKRRTEFGRALDSDLTVEDAYASARHGAVVFDGGAWRLVDFASSNGTFLNGKRLGTDTTNPTDLQDGDRIALGETEFVFKRI